MMDASVREDIIEVAEAEPRVELQRVPHPRAGADYNPSRHREFVRAGLALGLVVMLALLVGVLVVAVAGGYREWEELEQLATLTFTPLLSLTATMLGFYFGQKERARS